MARVSLASLRTRLLLLVLLAAIPALLLTLYTNLEECQLRKVLVHEHAMRLSRLVSADYERLIEDARQLVVSLARPPAVRDRHRTACNALFTDLLTQHSSYANLGVIDADGHVLCSALPITDQVYLDDRVYFRRAVETRDFAVGEYQVGRITRKATVNFGYPVLDDAGHIRAVVFAALDLAWLKALARQAGLPPGSMLTVIDRHGTILSRYPDEVTWIGQRMPEPLVLHAILSQQGNGTIDTPGMDGIPRLFSFAPFGSAAQSANAYVSLGIPAAVAFAGINQILARNIATLGLVAGLALAAAWLGGNLFLVRQIQALVRATKRVAAGELGVRSGLPQGQGELNQLAGAFDQMAESLERAHERRLLEEELRRKNYLSIFKFFVLDVPLRRMVAVSMDPAPDSALAPSFRGRPIGQLPASHYTPSASCLSAQPHR
jgi:HAMP domain-containing protein